MFIPVLPVYLINYMHAPMPFIVGVHPDMLLDFDMPMDVGHEKRKKIHHSIPG